jgi:hypothetical protein
MSVVHCKENKTLNSKEQAALDSKSKCVHFVECSFDNKVLVMPVSLLTRLDNHVTQPTENSSSTEVKDASKAINLGCDRADDAIPQKEVKSSTNGERKPFL